MIIELRYDYTSPKYRTIAHIFFNKSSEDCILLLIVEKIKMYYLLFIDKR